MDETLLQCLQSPMKSTFGPNGLNVLLLTESCTLSTSNGVQILDHCCPLHPLPTSILCKSMEKMRKKLQIFHIHKIGNIIKSSVHNVYSTTGDGSKRFIIMLLYIIDKMKYKGHLNNEISRCFRQLIALFSTDFIPLLQTRGIRLTEVTTEELTNIINRLLANCLSPLYSRILYKQIISVLTEYILHNNKKTVENINETLQFMLKHLDILVVLRDGLYTQLNLCDGILIKTRLLGKYYTNIINHPQKAVILNCSIDGVSLTGTVQISSSNDVTNMKIKQIFVLRNFLRYLSDNSVTLVLTKGQIAKELVPIFDEYKISIIPIIDEDVINVISQHYKAIITIDDMQSVEEINCISVIVTLSDTYCGYISVVFGGDNLISLRTIVIEAPTIEIGKQLKYSLKKSLLAILQLIRKDNKSVDYVYGGGSWEIHLIRIIESYLLKPSAPLLRNSLEWEALKSIEDSLFEVLSSLVHNCSSNTNNDHRKILKLHHEVYFNKSNAANQTIDSITGALRSYSCYDVIEPLSTIEYLLLNVLETVSNLLPLVYCSSPGYRTILAMKKQEKMGQEEDMTQTKQMTQDDEN